MSSIEEIFDYTLDLAYLENDGSHDYDENCIRIQGAIDICDRMDALEGWDSLDLYDECVRRYNEYLDGREDAIGRFQ